MITDAFLSFFNTFTTFLIGFMPSMKISLGLIEGQAALFKVINDVSCIAPVGTVGVIIGLIAIIYAVEFGWSVGNWLIAKIPFIE